MAFTNAFQGGQMFALQQDARQQALQAEEDRQLGRQALAEEFGQGALDPNAFSAVTGADRAERRLTSDLEQRSLQNDRTTRLDAAAQAEQARQVARQEAMDAERQDALERERAAAAAGNVVRFFRAGLENGQTPEQITERVTPALTALGVSPEEIGQLPQMIANDPSMLDELEGALTTTQQQQAERRLSLEERRLNQGTVRLGQGDLRIAQGERKLDQAEPGFQGAVAGAKKGEQLTAERVDTGLVNARQASVALANIDRQKELIDEGIRTGSLAEARQGAARFLADVLGMPQDQVSATDEFFARAGTEVAQQIQAFGAGTGLSDADREFARKIVGGEQSIDIEAIKRLIDMRAKVNRKVIDDYNKDRDAFVGSSERMQRLFPRVSTGASDVDALLDRYAPEGS